MKHNYINYFHIIYLVISSFTSFTILNILLSLLWKRVQIVQSLVRYPQTHAVILCMHTW